MSEQPRINLGYVKFLGIKLVTPCTTTTLVSNKGAHACKCKEKQESEEILAYSLRGIPILPTPILPTPVSPTLKFYLSPVSPTLVFCAIYCLLFMELW